MNYWKQPTGSIRQCIYYVATLAFGASVLLLACQPFATSQGYGNIYPRHLLMIPREGKLHITWEARHLTVAFNGEVLQRVLSMQGDITSHPEISQFAKIDRLKLDIYFTNATGRVLRQTVFYTAQNIRMKKILQAFNHRFDLPKGTTHIAFGYDAKIESHHFEHNPVR